MVVVVVVLVSMLVVVLVVGIILLRMHWLLFPLTRSHLECTGDEESLLECSGMFLHFAPDFTVKAFLTPLRLVTYKTGMSEMMLTSSPHRQREPQL